MRKYGESKTTRIMITTLPHITSGSGLRKFQADGFLLTRVYIQLTPGCFQFQRYIFQEFFSCKLVLQKFHLYTCMIHLLYLCSLFKSRQFILKSHISNYMFLYIFLFMNMMILIFMFAPYINIITTLFLFQLMHTIIKSQKCQNSLKL